MLLRAELARDASGTMCKWYGTAIDIHDRRCAEEEVGELAQRLTSTLESITDAFVELDWNWRVTYFNGAAEKLLSQPRDGALGKVVWDLFPSSVNTAFHREYHRARAQKTPFEFEEYSALTVKWFGVRAYPSEQGLSIYFRDVTRERLARETLRRSEERFEFVARATTDAVWDWDLTTDARWWKNWTRGTSRKCWRWRCRDRRRSTACSSTATRMRCEFTTRHRCASSQSTRRP